VAGIETSLAVRRAVFLIGIEALHNASSHSGARHVVVTLRPVGRRWQLEVRDDGSGLAPADGDNGRTGFGLATMKRRADEIGATLTIDSVPNAGTTVRLLFDARADDSRFQSRMNIRDLWTRIRGIK
jgi:signal transduction histidine kinase